MKIGAFAIILDKKDRVLFSHRNDMDLWNLPGGGVESDETPWEAVIREVKEETGLKVKVVRLVYVSSTPKRNKLVFTFLCKVTGGELSLSDEADEHQYFAFDDIPINSSPNQVDRLKKFFTDKKKVHLGKDKQKGSKDYLKQLRKRNLI